MEELSLKSTVNGRTKINHKSSPCHYVTGELKRTFFLLRIPLKNLVPTTVIVNVVDSDHLASEEAS